MKSLLSLILAFGYLLFTQSCVRVLYTPNMQNVPLLQEKNDFQATLNLQNFQGAYAITNHIGLMVNGQFIRGKVKEDFLFLTQEQIPKTKLLEGGVGYFTSFGKGGVIEIYGGGGKGSISFDALENTNTGGNYLDKYSAKSSRLFIQSSVGMKKGSFDFAFSLRFLRLNFYDADTSEYTYNSSIPENPDLSQLELYNYSFIEPGLTFRYGFRYIKVQVQYTYSKQLDSHKIEHVDGKLNVGVHINIAEMYKNKQ
jgi:hypothetical protein